MRFLQACLFFVGLTTASSSGRALRAGQRSAAVTGSGLGPVLLDRRQDGGDTSDLPRPQLGSVPYGVDLRSCSVTGKMALTFDDGPKMYTAELLDLLAANSVTATFFVLGVNFAQYGSLVRRIFDAGHQVASHSWSHQDLATLSPEGRRAEILSNEAALVGAIGVIPTYFRPPYTSCGQDCVADLGSYGYHVTNYNLDTRDWENGGTSSRDIFTNVVDNSNPASIGFITLAHDVHETTVHGLVQFMVDKARAKGYELVSLGECLGDPRENWYRDPVTGGSWSIGGEQESASPSSASSPSPSPRSLSSSDSVSGSGPVPGADSISGFGSSSSSSYIPGPSSVKGLQAAESAKHEVVDISNTSSPSSVRSDPLSSLVSPPSSTSSSGPESESSPALLGGGATNALPSSEPPPTSDVSSSTDPLPAHDGEGDVAGPSTGPTVMMSWEALLALQVIVLLMLTR